MEIIQQKLEIPENQPLRLSCGAEVLLDYYSVVLEDCLLSSFFARVGFEKCYEAFAEFFATATDRLSMNLHVVRFTFPFGMVEIPLRDNQDAEYYKLLAASILDDCMPPPEIHVDRFRLCCSGTHLHNLRVAGFPVEQNFTDSAFWITDFKGASGEDVRKVAQSFHVTRTDFAFDLVNVPGFDDDFSASLLREFCALKARGVRRLFHGKPGGLAYDPQYGETIECLYIGKGEKSVTSGTGSSAEFLRIYNKKLEVSVKEYKGAPSDKWPENQHNAGCKSWIRVELQCRRQYAERLLFMMNPDGSARDTLTKFGAILSYIRRKFSVAPSKNEPIVPQLEKLFVEISQEKISFI